MAFEILLNNPMTEPQLLELLTSEVRKNHDQHQNTFFFFKLKYLGDKISEIIWQKTFNTRYEFADFYYDSKLRRAAIMLKFCKGRYEVLCQGFYYFDRFELWPDKIVNSRPIESVPEDIDCLPAPSRELLDRGFGEITRALASSKSDIPM